MTVIPSGSRRIFLITILIGNTIQLFPCYDNMGNVLRVLFNVLLTPSLLGINYIQSFLIICTVTAGSHIVEILRVLLIVTADIIDLDIITVIS